MRSILSIQKKHYCILCYDTIRNSRSMNHRPCPPPTFAACRRSANSHFRALNTLYCHVPQRLRWYFSGWDVAGFIPCQCGRIIATAQHDVVYQSSSSHVNTYKSFSKYDPVSFMPKLNRRNPYLEHHEKTTLSQPGSSHSDVLACAQVPSGTRYQ